MNTNKGSVVKQSSNDVEGCRSQKILFQPNKRAFLQYSVNRQVWLENFFVNTAKCWQPFTGLLQIYHSYYNEMLTVDKLTSITLAYNSLAVFVINSEYMKRITKFGTKYIQKTISYLNLFTDFNLLSWISRNQSFLCQSTGPVALIFHHNLLS